MAKFIGCLAVLAVVGFASAHPFRHDPFNPLGPWHKRTMHCGLPRFLHKLPTDLQEKVKAVWANYVEGEECFKEMKQTRELVHSLPSSVRHRVFKGMCGPSFLRNSSSTVRNEFKKVWFNANLTIDEKELAFKRLAYSLLSGDSLQQFVKWEAELQERKHERNARIEKLSPAAKAAYDKWMAMRKDERNFLNTLSTEIRAELRLVCGFCGGHKHGSGPGDKEGKREGSSSEEVTTSSVSSTSTAVTGTPSTTAASSSSSSSSSSSAASVSTTESATESPKEETEKFFKFHDDSLDNFIQRSEEEILNEADCTNYYL
uniref:SXP/RAL-2 family protein Ani s 5-like cation-binding domain-containing protein n=1 Tax=Panagrellus redivivus TaxID=6233 RepID=A0A7E4VTR9_PANRE